MKALKLGTIITLTLLLSHCQHMSLPQKQHQVLISVADQKMRVYDEQGMCLGSYPISTSKFGLGSELGSHKTPLGKLKIAKKIGHGAESGTVFSSRKPTGEILKPNSPGRDPIVTRILWLKGVEPHNKNTFRRYIYIHGTPEERKIGSAASYGCIRMKSKHIITFFDQVAQGTQVTIFPESFLEHQAKLNEKA